MEAMEKIDYTTGFRAIPFPWPKGPSDDIARAFPESMDNVFRFAIANMDFYGFVMLIDLYLLLLISLVSTTAPSASDLPMR